MAKTKIEWCDYTINPVKGLCPMSCSYCYARRMYKRFKWNPEIRFDRKGLLGTSVKPSRIFVGSTMELFGEWVKPEWLEIIFTWCKIYKEDTFIFLTKQPQNLPREFPNNCWIGVSCTNHRQFHDASYYLQRIKAKVRFYSFEPLLEHINLESPNPYFMGDWVIIGAQTPYSKKTAPRKEWVDEIIDAADKAKIPVFLKDNLRPVLINVYGKWMPMRQEFPNEKEATNG